MGILDTPINTKRLALRARLIAAAAASRGRAPIDQPAPATPPTITTSATNLDATLATSYNIAATGSVFRVLGGTITQYSGAYYRFPCVTRVGTGNAVGNRDALKFAVEFFTDASRIQLELLKTTNSIAFEIDGQPLSALVPMPTGAGGDAYFLLDFGSAKTRRIRVWGQTSDGFYRAFVPNTAQVWAGPKPITMAAFGDSITSGTGAEARPDTAWATTLGQLLGWEDVRLIAIGGTGFTNSGTDSKFGDSSRLSDLTDANPDVIIVAASPNDVGATDAALTAAALAAFQSYRATCPNAPIIVGGQYQGVVAPVTAKETAVKAAFDQWGDPNSYWVPNLTDPSGVWTTGSGKIGSRTAADGATTSGSTTVTSATIAFTGSDGGRIITGAGIPAGTTVASITNATTAVLSAAATATATGVSLTMTNQTGFGNNDVYCYDGTHPSLAGHIYHARRWETAIRTLVLPAMAAKG